MQAHRSVFFLKNSNLPGVFQEKAEQLSGFLHFLTCMRLAALKVLLSAVHIDLLLLFGPSTYLYV